MNDAVHHSRDIAQVHAVNILRILVQDSSLVTAISRHYAALTMQALNGFTSPLWAVRNASLQLLGYFCLHLFSGLFFKFFSFLLLSHLVECQKEHTTVLIVIYAHCVRKNDATVFCAQC